MDRPLIIATGQVVALLALKLQEAGITTAADLARAWTCCRRRLGAPRRRKARSWACGPSWSAKSIRPSSSSPSRTILPPMARLAF